MSRTTRRSFAKAMAAAGAALPLVTSNLLGQESPSPLADALVGVVRAQSGQHLDAADIDRIRSDFKDYVSLLERLRNVPLANSDEPDYTFVSLAKRWS